MGPSGGGRPHAVDAPLFAVCEDVFGNDPAVRPTDTMDDGDNRSRGKNMPEASMFCRFLSAMLNELMLCHSQVQNALLCSF